MNSKELQNITMSRGGAYSLATRGAQDVINAAIPIVDEALLKIDLEEKEISRLQTWVVQMEEHRSR